MSGWYVASSLPHQEARAEINLRRQGYKTWLPQYRRSRRHARRIDTILAPLFPGYLFIHLDPDRDAWLSINGTYGVRRVICQNDRPARLPDDFIEALRGTLDQQGLGGIPERWLQPGVRVRVLSGPFVDHLGTLVSLASRDRVALLLNVVGRDVSALMPRHAVAPAI